MENWSWTNSQEEHLWARDTIVDGASAAMSLFRFQVTTNSTSAVINDDRYASAKSIRTSTVIIACINAVAALATAATIFWDSYARSRRRQSGIWLKSGGLGLVSGRDAFPFVLSIGIVIQAVIFAVAQSTGLQAMLVLGCTLTSQLMFPAAFIVPYLQLVFGLEIAARALGPGSFRPPRRWAFVACIALVVLLLLAHVLVGQLVRPSNLCFASLFWFLQRYSVLCFGLFLAIPGALVLATAGVVFRLKRDGKVPLEQRVTASQMVYYMAVAIISDLLLVPFFHSLAFLNQHDVGPMTLQLSLISAVVANVSGIITGGLYLFLRSNTLSTIGGDVRSQPTTFDSGPYSNAIAAPNLAPLKTDSTESLVAGEKQREEEAIIESPVMPPPSVYGSASSGRDSYSTRSSIQSLPSPRPFQRSPPPPALATTQNNDLIIQLVPDEPQTPYSIFPPTRTATSSMQSIALLPSTTYTPPSTMSPVRPPPEYLNDFLVPPPMIRAPGTIRHRRDSSMISSATVQIGLRLSNVGDMAPIQARCLQDAGKVYSISGVDDRLTIPPPPLPPPGRRPSPLSIATQLQPGVYNANDAYPRPASSVYPVEETLDARTYEATSPKGVKLPSPKGVGFNMPPPPPRRPWI